MTVAKVPKARSSRVWSHRGPSAASGFRSHTGQKVTAFSAHASSALLPNAATVKTATVKAVKAKKAK